MNKLSVLKYWHELFELTVLIKGVNGIFEIVSGFLVLFLSKATISRLFFSLIHNELIEDPHDKIINFFAQLLQNFTYNIQIFAAIYILFHGFLNIFLAVQLYRDKHWAYLVTINIMLIFLVYQIYRINIYHSPILISITLFDIFFIFMTWHEYKYHTDKNESII